MTGIQESLELLEGVKLLVVETKTVLKDGKIDFADLPVLLDLLSNLSVLSKAVQGVGQVPTELKDLSPDEINQLMLKVLEIVNAVKAA